MNRLKTAAFMWYYSVQTDDNIKSLNSWGVCVCVYIYTCVFVRVRVRVRVRVCVCV